MPKPDAGLVREVITFKEAAAYLRCGPATVTRLVKRGEIPAFKVGSAWRIKRDALHNWIARQHQAANEARR